MPGDSFSKLVTVLRTIHDLEAFAMGVGMQPAIAAISQRTELAILSRPLWMGSQPAQVVRKRSDSKAGAEQTI